MYKGKKVLVTGGTGLIGRPLVELLLREGAHVRVASLDNKHLCPGGAGFIRGDLRDISFCKKVAKGMNYVFHLAGLKGSPEAVATKPASFFTNIILVNTNMMEAARQEKVDRFLYCSSIGVYPPAEVLREDDVWKGFPSRNDWYAGWAKRMGELQVAAYGIEYHWGGVKIVRPANVYGPWDNFDLKSAMVVPSLIRRAVSGEDPLIVWGDGSAIRDFIYSRDVAKGMMIALGLAGPINLGSGVGCSIKQLVEIILSNLINKPQIIWDEAKPSGDKKRVLDTSRAKILGFSPEVSLEQGIKETMEWYQANSNSIEGRFNIFK